MVNKIQRILTIRKISYDFFSQGIIFFAIIYASFLIEKEFNYG